MSHDPDDKDDFIETELGDSEAEHSGDSRIAETDELDAAQLHSGDSR